MVATTVDTGALEPGAVRAALVDGITTRAALGKRAGPPST
jgi:hypothetical protein